MHTGLETMSGYESAPNPRARPALSSLPKPEVLAPLTTLNGVPVWKSVMPETDHPPKSMRVSSEGPPYADSGEALAQLSTPAFLSQSVQRTKERKLLAQRS